MDFRLQAALAIVISLAGLWGGCITISGAGPMNEPPLRLKLSARRHPFYAALFTGNLGGGALQRGAAVTTLRLRGGEKVLGESVGESMSDEGEAGEEEGFLGDARARRASNREKVGEEEEDAWSESKEGSSSYGTSPHFIFVVARLPPPACP